MLLAGSRFTDIPIMSLQTGTELARTTTAIIDPANLTIVAFEVEGPLLDVRPSLLRLADVREYSDLGFIIDSSDEFVQPDDVIKLGELYKLQFTPLDRQVRDDHKKKLGKVNGFTVDTNTFMIQQLSVEPGIFRRISTSSLLVHRKQIVEINDTAIIVKAPDIKAKTKKAAPIDPKLEYINPFRGSRPQTEHTDRQS